MELAHDVFHCTADELLMRLDRLPLGGSVELSEMIAFYSIKSSEARNKQPKVKRYKKR